MDRHDGRAASRVQDSPAATTSSSSTTDAPTKRGGSRAAATAVTHAIPPAARHLLENYSGIAPEDVNEHVSAVRAAAFAQMPYDALAQLNFLTFTLPEHPAYPRVLDHLRAGGHLLDAGCCAGQELRRLRFFEDIPAVQLHGIDIEPRFLQLGFQLFDDAAKLGAAFEEMDLLHAPCDQRQLPDFTVILANALFHLWDWPDQLDAAVRFARVTSGPGALVLGRQPAGQQFRHDEDSMRRLWNAVGKETGTAWDVDAAFVPECPGETSWPPGETEGGELTFCATRTR